MNVDAERVIDKLCEQISVMAKIIAVKDAQIELLHQEITKLSK